MHHPLQNEYNIITGLGNSCVHIFKFAHAQTQYIPLVVVKVADVLFDVVLGVGTVVEGELGSFKVNMRDVNQMSILYVVTKKKTITFT